MDASVFTLRGCLKVLLKHPELYDVAENFILLQMF